MQVLNSKCKTDSYEAGTNKCAPKEPAFYAKQETLWNHATIDGKTVETLLAEKRRIAVKPNLTGDELDQLDALNKTLRKVDFMGRVKYHPISKVKARPDMDYEKELLDATIEDLKTGKVTPDILKATIKAIDDEVDALKNHDGKDGVAYNDEFKAVREEELRSAQIRMANAIKVAYKGKK